MELENIGSEPRPLPLIAQYRLGHIGQEKPPAVAPSTGHEEAPALRRIEINQASLAVSDAHVVHKIIPTTDCRHGPLRRRHRRQSASNGHLRRFARG